VGDVAGAVACVKIEASIVAREDRSCLVRDKDTPKGDFAAGVSVLKKKSANTLG